MTEKTVEPRAVTGCGERAKNDCDEWTLRTATSFADCASVMHRAADEIARLRAEVTRSHIENDKLRKLVSVTNALWVATLDYPDTETSDKLREREEALRIELGLPVQLTDQQEELSRELGFEVRI